MPWHKRLNVGEESEPILLVACGPDALGRVRATQPDLSKIAISRTPRDLIEALIFPSASFVNGYRPYIVVTTAGKTHTGVISSETIDTITLKLADLTEVPVPRKQIDELKEGTVSIMPKGLDTQLTPDELRNLLAYLRARK